MVLTGLVNSVLRNMVAWKTVFLLQCRETNEVCYWLPIFRQMTKWVLHWR
jgi:hypothetical protein